MNFGEYFESIHRVVRSGKIRQDKMTMRAMLYLSMIVTSFEDEILSVGLGWFVTDYKGVRVIWHYGYWTASSTLIIKVPSQGLAFVLFANTDGLSAPYPLGAGRLELGRRFDGVLAWDGFFHLSMEHQRNMFSRFASHAKRGAALMFTSGPGEVKQSAPTVKSPSTTRVTAPQSTSNFWPRTASSWKHALLRTLTAAGTPSGSQLSQLSPWSNSAIHTKQA